MAEAIWAPNVSCADMHGSHSPRPDTQMSCCSSATEAPLLAPAETLSPRIAKHWSVACVATRTPLVLSSIARQHTASRPPDLSMIETTITLKPEAEWRPNMTPERLTDEIEPGHSAAGRDERLDLRGYPEY